MIIGRTNTYLGKDRAKHTENSQFLTVNSADRRKFKGIWGTIRSGDIEVAAGKIIASNSCIL
jgi:hypothetical protein